MLTQLRFVILTGVLAGLLGCSPPPRFPETPVDTGATVAPDSALARAIRPQAESHPGMSGVMSLEQGQDAFAARVALARAAEHTLDVQYYIWRPDMTGLLMFEALVDAAERGVAVRLLLDDNNGRDLDPYLAELHEHRNIEVRLFNPFVLRGARLLNFLTDFDRLNRRMHNKSFTVDGQVAIVGGRNIADAYFDATDDVWFVDLDVLAVGPVVRDVVEDFDRYWYSASSYPADHVLADTFAARGNIRLAEQVAAVHARPEAKAYLDAVADSKLLFDLRNRQLQLDWVPVEMVSDDPRKGLGHAHAEEMLPQQLQEVIGEPERDVELVTPYFIPTDAGVAAFADLINDGVSVRVLTNALEATDMSVAHAGYAKFRRSLLEAGVELFEARLQPGGEPQGSGLLGISGSSSSSSLHAKTFAVDGERVFVGSFNFDPRSVNFNTEMGFVIRSPALARKMDDAFATSIPERAYQVTLDDGHLVWLKREDGDTVRLTREPGVSWMRLAWVRFVSWLPVEGLL